MKSRLLSAVLCILSVSFLHAQSHLSKEEFTSLICGKWKMAEARMEGRKTSEMGVIMMSFESNGTYEMHEEGEAVRGKWSFNTATQELLTEEKGGIQKHKIMKLTKTLLTTETTEANETFMMTFTKL